MGYSPQDQKELDTTERLTLLLSVFTAIIIFCEVS